MSTAQSDPQVAARGGTAQPCAASRGRGVWARRACQLAGAALLSSLMTGCFIIQMTILGAAALVGLTGYVVYEVGDAAVTGVGNAARATGNVVSSGTRSVVKVVSANGELKVDAPGDVGTVWQASKSALQRA